MKKYFLQKIKEAGFELKDYETSHQVWAKGWNITINPIGDTLNWYRDYFEYFVGELNAKENMIELFNDWIKKVKNNHYKN